MDASDLELMTRLAAGEDLALNDLITRWSDRIIAFLLRMTGHRETAVDLAQETFVKLYQSRHRYQPHGQFSTYLFAIAANLARNHNRWQSRHPTVSLDTTHPDGSPDWPTATDPHLTPDASALAHEQSSTIHAAILKLPPDLREALTLFVHEDMSYAHIAHLTHCSAKAVETRIYRARQILKEHLKNLI